MTRKSAFARVFPFAVFIAFLAAQPLLDGALDARWVAVARGVAVAALLAYFWRDYTELRQAPTAPAWHWLLAVAAGAAVFALWIRLDSGWAVMGEPGRGFVPLRAESNAAPPIIRCWRRRWPASTGR